MKIERRTAEVWEFHEGHEYAVFTVYIRPNDSYFSLSIESSFGGYAFAWTHPGGDFYKFLAGLNLDYVKGKMVGRDEVYDSVETSREIRKEILQLRREKSVSAEVALKEWMEADEVESGGEIEFSQWCQDSDLFRDSEPYLLYRTTDSARARDFARMYEMFWPAFSAELRETKVQ